MPIEKSKDEKRTEEQEEEGGWPVLSLAVSLTG